MIPETAFILAAGLGTRMRPLTDNRPKALVEVGGRSLIDHMLDRLVAAGAKRFVINVHYFADRLEAHLKARTDLDIIISDERDALLETGGGLKKARPLLGEAPIWVANIDSVWIESDPDGTALKALCDQWNTDEMDAALLVTAMETSHGFDGPGDFFLNDGRLAFRNDAASAPWNYMGVHITKPQIVYAEPDGAFSLSRIWRRLAPEGRLHGTVFTGEWMHVGDPAARDFAEARLKA
ncbi:nucleotidyltransferase family protein [Asticcacaulis taihuensis]|uniref:MobA-like NTP transferase domain-containing protein n=1 Tax=Asticcacaulis taihuensis TaxID=260084 RepID=A0A1G4RGZ2_9CAUL|nr:nucleotidyltransferase family protein [Asticcacaulis taihuensis]SCW55911.1 MobA-like NTP transferase domain-containing protein [Asticcacaulis taihuensis]